MMLEETIVAISSGVGAGARMIVRISGADAQRLLKELGVQSGGGGSASREVLRVAGMSVPAWVYWFAGPHSYTGQDLAELHLPGNPLLARMVLNELIHLGARAAEAGEFTARAYFAGKMDLTQAEGVAAMIGAHSEAELSAARRLLSGELARRLRPVMDALAQTMALVEVGFDFSEEDVRFLQSEELHRRICEAQKQLRSLVEQSESFEKLAHEPTIVLAGWPNAGKSTLANALAGHRRAIVSSTAGTTRDVLSTQIELPGGLARLLDVAGLEEGEVGNEQGIDSQMQQRARRAIEEADVVVLVHAMPDRRRLPQLGREADITVFSKADLGGEHPLGIKGLPVSAVTGLNLDTLRVELGKLAFGPASGGTLALTARHLAAIEEAQKALKDAAGQIDSFPELLAADLRHALDALGQILGVVTTEDLLGRIFSAFCIGK